MLEVFHYAICVQLKKKLYIYKYNEDFVISVLQTATRIDFVIIIDVVAQLLLIARDFVNILKHSNSYPCRNIYLWDKCFKENAVLKTFPSQL